MHKGKIRCHRAYVLAGERRRYQNDLGKVNGKKGQVAKVSKRKQSGWTGQSGVVDIELRTRRKVREGACRCRLGKIRDMGTARMVRNWTPGGEATGAKGEARQRIWTALCCSLPISCSPAPLAQPPSAQSQP